MTTTIWVGIYGLLFGYGVGLRVAAYYYRKAVKQPAAEIKALADS